MKCAILGSMEFYLTTDAYDINQPIEERFRHFSAAGFTGVHWSEHWISDFLYTEAYMRHVARLAERCHLSVPSVHGVCRIGAHGRLTEEHWHELNVNRIEFVSMLGGDCIVIHLPLDQHEKRIEPERDQSQRLIDRLLPVARNHGVQIAIENLETRPCRQLFDHLFRLYSAEDLGFCFDSGHAYIRSGLDLLDRYFDRLIMTHLHDNHGTDDEHLLPGQGTMEWEPIIQTLKRRPQLTYLNLEVLWPGTMPKEQWCREAYQSIASLWTQGHRGSVGPQ